MSSVPRRALRYLVRKAFPYLERYAGIHVTPVHYYSPIPTTYELEPEVFSQPFSGLGINWNADRQLETLKAATNYLGEYTPLQNTGLSLLDAMMLYAAIRERKPALMIEIGSGETTRISLQALRRNRDEGHPFKLLAIEPYPSAALRQLRDADLEVRAMRLQKVELASFERANLLFIDSTHVSRVGSDVNYEVLEIVPSLRPGTLIHWHDIPMPMNYWKDWIQSGNQFWNESYLVHALLMYNDVLSIRWASNFMRLHYRAALESAFPPDWATRRISSLWVEKVR